MFKAENIKRIFPLLEEIEKERSCFGGAEKQTLYRIAFHTEDFGEVQKLILQAAAPHLKDRERKCLLDSYAEGIPKPPNDTARQIENYIFQMYHMTYEKEKANTMLEELLKQRGLEKEIEAMIAVAQEKKAEIPKHERTVPCVEKIK